MNGRKKGLDRRSFLGATAKATASLALSGALTSLAGCDCREGDGGSDAGPGDGGSDAGPGDGGAGTALVGLARGATVEDGVRRAVALTPGGLSFIASGDTVLLKPNMNSDDPFPYTTNPEVVAAVVAMALEAGAGRVVVGDRSNGSYDTLAAMTATGVYDAAIDAGAEVMAFDDATWVYVEPAGIVSWPSGWHVPEFIVNEVDHVINLPCLKHHFMANYTGAFKNWIGILELPDRSVCHNDLGGRCPELHLAIQEKFVITDGTRACLTGGPLPGGDTADPALYVATADPIANDVTALALLKHFGSTAPFIQDIGVWEQPQIVAAIARGLGITGPSGYSAAGDGVPELAQILAYITG